MLIFVEGERPKNPEKKAIGAGPDENQQQSQQTYDTGSSI